MGYDMHWINKPEGEVAAVQAARDQFDAAVKDRDALPREERGEWTKAEYDARKYADDGAVPANASERYRQAQRWVSDAYNAMISAKRSYFRLNVWGMGMFADAMLQLGVLRDDYSMDDAPPWPDYYPDGYHDWDDGEGEFDAETVARFQRVKQQVTARRSWSPGIDGIPAHKFGSNDGWIVTPEECRHAANTIRATDPDDVAKALIDAGIGNRDYWDQWVQWLADAAEHGGFEVW